MFMLRFVFILLTAVIGVGVLLLFFCSTQLNARRLFSPYLLKYRHDRTCRGCIHFKEKEEKCKKFKTLLDSYTVDFDKAIKCRLDPFKCGIFGKHFVEDNSK